MDLDPRHILSILAGGNPRAALGFLTVFFSVGVVPLLLGRVLAFFNPSIKPPPDARQPEKALPEKTVLLRRLGWYAFWGLTTAILYISMYVAIELLADINLLIQAFLAGSVFLTATFGLLAVFRWRNTRDSNDPNVVPAKRLRGYVTGQVAAASVGFIGINALYHRGPRLEIPFLIAFIILFSAQNIRRAFRT
jgi:hypothetical protein